MLNVKTCGITGEIKGIELENLCNNADILHIYTTDGIYKCLFSYNTLIVITKGGYIYRISNKWNFSKTTGKHRNMFLNRTCKELEKFIKDKMTYCPEIEQYILKKVGKI
jgi:hypothetical protein